MRKIATSLLALGLCAALAGSASAANSVRISQVFGGGGGSGFYLNDYVELFNNGGSAVDLSNWTIEYGSSTGSWGSSGTNIFTFPSGASIQPCSYVLVAMPAGTSGNALPVTPDYNGTLTISQSSGKVALFNAVNTNLACGSELVGTLVDKVSWASANCPEGTNVSNAVNLTNQQGVVRNNGGIDDTDDNSADFAVVSGPVPHNSGSPANTACLATPTTSQTWGKIKVLYR